MKDYKWMRKLNEIRWTNPSLASAWLNLNQFNGNQNTSCAHHPSDKIMQSGTEQFLNDFKPIVSWSCKVTFTFLSQIDKNLRTFGLNSNFPQNYFNLKFQICNAIIGRRESTRNGDELLFTTRNHSRFQFPSYLDFENLHQFSSIFDSSFQKQNYLSSFHSNLVQPSKLHYDHHEGRRKPLECHRQWDFHPLLTGLGH